MLLSKLLQFALDSQPLLFVDSTAFIINAERVSYPERSYLYSYLVRFLGLRFHSFEPLLAAQLAMGAAVSGLLAFSLIRHCRVRPWIALTAGVIFAWDPTQIVAEHLVMTETTAGLVAAVFLLTALEYLRSPRLLWAALLGFIGMVLVGVRLVYVPLVFGAALILPLLAWLPTTSYRRRAVMLFITGTSIALGQFAYTHLTGWIMEREAAYHYRTGVFALGAVSPMVLPEDAADPRSAAAIREQQHSSHPLSDPGPNNRNVQLWEPVGLIARLTRAWNNDRDRVDREAASIVAAAVRRDPLAFLGLAIAALLDYPRLLTSNFVSAVRVENGSDRGVQLSAREWEFLKTRFPSPTSANSMERTLSRRFHSRGRYLAWIQFLSPVLGLLACLVAPRDVRRSVAWLAVWSGLVLAATCLTTPISIRYLHPLSFTGLAAIAVLGERIAQLTGSRHRPAFARN